MKFTFSNIGFIDSGNVELGNLTVICGRNNTGKTYISHSIYGLLKTCFSANIKITERVNVDTLTKEGECIINVPDVCGILEKASLEFSKNSLGDVFSSEGNAFKDSSVMLSVDEICNEKFKSYEHEEIIHLGGRNHGSDLRISTKSGSMDIQVNLINPTTVSLDFVRFAIDRQLSRFIFNAFVPNSFVITSERTGAAMFYKDLDSQANSILDQLVQLKSNKKLDPFLLMEKMRSRYSLPIRDNIENMRYAQEIIKKNSVLIDNNSNEPIFSKLEELIGGRYKTSEKGVYYISHKKREKDRAELPMHLASSATKSLYLLDLYLRHIAIPGDVLVIDEPELNLHPDAQRKLAQLLVRITHANIKIIVTTHSDHLLRELNTLTMLSNDSIDQEEKDEILSKYHIDHCDIIKPSEITAYVNSSSTHQIHKMLVNEFGIHMDLFSKEINESSELSKEVYYLIP